MVLALELPKQSHKCFLRRHTSIRNEKSPAIIATFCTKTLNVPCRRLFSFKLSNHLSFTFGTDFLQTAYHLPLQSFWICKYFSKGIEKNLKHDQIIPAFGYKLPSLFQHFSSQVVLLSSMKTLHIFRLAWIHHQNLGDRFLFKNFQSFVSEKYFFELKVFCKV